MPGPVVVSQPWEQIQLPVTAVATIPGRGWFPVFRNYSPTDAYFNKIWKLPDITTV